MAFIAGRAVYEQQDAGQADMNLRGKLVTDEQGRFWFRGR